MWSPELFKVDEFRDGALILTCGDEGMETDLVFSAGYISGDEGLEQQREILEYIVEAVKAYRC